jgi:hypothetical protein
MTDILQINVIRCITKWTRLHPHIDNQHKNSTPTPPLVRFIVKQERQRINIYTQDSSLIRKRIYTACEQDITRLKWAGSYRKIHGELITATPLS